MKIAVAQLTAATDALAEVLTMRQPADAALYQFFRAHPHLGQTDRTFIAETVFGVLRRRYSLEYAFGRAGVLTPRRLLLAFLNRVAGISARALEPLLRGNDANWLAVGAARATNELSLEIAAELPSWLIARLQHELPQHEILALGRALAQPATLDLRINPLLVTREEVLAQFTLENIPARATPYSPLGIRLGCKPSLSRHPLFVGGKIEIQDEGSQLLCFLVAPKRREMVVDFCAGAGGKTLTLGALMRNQGRLYAFDVVEKRLQRLKMRLKRSQLSNVHPQRIRNENDVRIKRLAAKIDRVLVDAPCSGFGTLRRNPDLKWRQHENDIVELAAKQAAILQQAATLLKPGGRLVYATCSFLRAENQDIVDRFLTTHPHFQRLDSFALLMQEKIALDAGDDFQLWPHRHGCDGFFAAVMERNG